MTAEQKQRALTALGMWHSSNDSSQREYQAAELMAALLQELIDAPETEPVARVTGYYAGYLSIETIDGRVLPAGTAVYTSPPAPSVPDGWIRAIDEAMVVHHIGIADRADSYEVAKKKLNALLAINSDIARDCSEAPADVVRDAEPFAVIHLDGSFVHVEFKQPIAGTGKFEVYAAPPAPSVPDGWKLVPYTPTDEMLEQAAYAVNNRPQPSKYEPSATPAIIFWTAMLNYAPEAVFINSCSKPPKLSDERIAELYQAAFGMPINDEYGPTEVHDFARAIEREIFGGEQA